MPTVIHRQACQGHILKIDRSFVEPIGDGRQAVALVRSIIGIADALDLDVIAEGAETAAPVELLTQSAAT